MILMGIVEEIITFSGKRVSYLLRVSVLFLEGYINL